MPTHNIDLYKQINELLLEYGDQIRWRINEAMPKVAEETVQFFKTDSRIPDRTGDYKKGWRAKAWGMSSAYQGVTIYNATDWQLTHLLENGHAARDGGWVEARPHIIYANEFAQKRLVEMVKEEIESI